MAALTDLVATKKVPRFRIPPAAMREDIVAARRDDTALLLRISAGLAVLTLMAVGLLIAEPWETLRPWLLHP
ncbi:MAG: hypothetical protein JWP87_5949 [Labilithrix sp.]|jgi:hypothetical protein|nr:hypothetical protein [Labilithrix sp.]